ncbi:MAG: hypothetical protein JSS86_24100 [Cyanobacteria bacterium SZAS LIN-2]|nr:hypothetical protein [Cyanobacteria bacterium SZAS LIN-2]
MLATILVSVLVAAISGGSGYYISGRFWKSAYASKNTSGDFGSPRGGVFASMSGVLIGLLFMRFIGQYIFTADVAGPAFIVAIVAGAIGGFIPLIRSKKS